MTPGQYLPYKVNLKCGSLDFMLTVGSTRNGQSPVTILPTTVDVDVSLLPVIGGEGGREGGRDHKAQLSEALFMESEIHEGFKLDYFCFSGGVQMIMNHTHTHTHTHTVFLSSYQLECQLRFQTGGDTAIPEGAGVRVIVSNDLQCSVSGIPAHIITYNTTYISTYNTTHTHSHTLTHTHTHTISDSYINSNRHEGTTAISFKLPAIPEGSEYSTALSLLVPSIRPSQLTAKDPKASGCSLVGVARSHDQIDQSHYACRHEVFE